MATTYTLAVLQSARTSTRVYIFSCKRVQHAFGAVACSGLPLWRRRRADGYSGGNFHGFTLHDVSAVSPTRGAGFLGISLCRYLLARGHMVRSLDTAPFQYAERALVDVIDGDIRDRVAVERAMADVGEACFDG